MKILRKTKGSGMPIIKEKYGVTYFSFPNLEKIEGVAHLFSTRLGGVSEGDQGTMNLSYEREENKENVTENFRRIAKVLDTTIENFVLSDQTHRTNIRVVTEEDLGKGIIKKKDYAEVDGLITNCKNIALSTLYADCVPLYFVDPIKAVIGLSHGGWKGTVGKIAQITVLRMEEEFGCNPKDIQVAIAPSICQSCYEVSQDVAYEFIQLLQEKEMDAVLEESISELVTPQDGGKYLLDLWKVNFYVLRMAGILAENIAVTDICTCCNKEILFSHRGSKGKRGNLGAFLMLK